MPEHESPGGPGDAPAAATGSPAGRVRRERAQGRSRWQAASAALSSRWDILAVISAGGAIGSLARWALAAALPHAAGAFPWATFAANVSGCLLIGALMVMISDVWPPSRHARPFLGVGVLGGYTTFSTYMLDARSLLMAGHAGAAGGYLIGSLAGGLAAVWAGTALARTAVRGARRHARRAARDSRADSGRRAAHDAGEPEPASPPATRKR